MTTDVDVEDEKKNSQVADLLQSPRKKKKNYIVLALGPNFDADLGAQLQGFLRKQYPQLSLAIPRNEQEFTRLFSRIIKIAIVDDQFSELKLLLKNLKHLKEKNREVGVPVVFLTDNVHQLVSAYHSVLLPYQETDNYITFRGLPASQICAHIQGTFAQKSARRSRRFEFDIAVRYFRLASPEPLEGLLLEMSAHGGLLQSSHNLIFKERDQLLLHIPTAGVLPSSEGEFIRLPARIRRIFMDGRKAAISWEYLSQEQYVRLTRYLLEFVNLRQIRLQNKKK